MGFKAVLSEYLTKYNIQHSDKVLEECYVVYNMLIDGNKRFNLTAITDEHDVIIKHFVDSLLTAKFIKNNSKLLDIGSGAGFPALPLKILNPSLNITAIDSVNKKVGFINSVKERLNFDEFTAIHTRAEVLARQPQHREKYDVVTLRAVARLNVLAEYALPFLKDGGVMIAYKGQSVQEEIDEGAAAIKKLGGSFREVHYIDLEGMQRSIVIIEKTSPSPSIYPRLGNKPRTNPIV